MKKLSTLLAAAFIAICLVSFVEAKEYHIVNIGGQQYVAVMGSDGHVKSLVEPGGKVLEAGNLFQKESVPTLPKRVIPNQIKKAEISHQPKALVAETPAQTEVKQSVAIPDQLKNNKKFAAVRPTRGECLGNDECQKINDWAAKIEEANVATSVAQITVAEPKPVKIETSAPKQNTGATNIGRKTETAPQHAVAEVVVPKQHGQKEISKAAPQHAVAEVVVPKQHGREVSEKPYENKPEAQNQAPAGKDMRVEYFLFDRRGYSELRQIAQNFRREESGELIIANLQDRTREDKVPKAKFFEVRYVGDKPVHYREAYMVPTEELIEFSESRRVPGSPGFQIKNKKS